MSFLKDLIDSFAPTAYAEEPVEITTSDEPEVEAEVSAPLADDDAEEEEEEAAEPAAEAADDDDEDDDDDDDDDEDEEEAGDQLDTLRKQCADTKECAHSVHHYAECVERVTQEMEEEGYDEKDYKEDCVEEFFHLQHCVNDCAAPKLFYKLK